MRFSISNLNPERLKVMKKIYIALAVAATALLVSCVKEESFRELSPIGENGIAFTIQNASTRAMEGAPNNNVKKGVSFPIGVDPKGEPLFLEETIEELNPTPTTKGAPAYTVNVGDLYPAMGVYAAIGDGIDVPFELMDWYEHKGNPKDVKNTNGWRYSHSFDGSIWPDNPKQKVDFYLRMPAESMAEEFDYSTANSIGFHYTSVEDGSSQQDILFAHTSISKEDHDGYLPNGAPVLMYHALSGVKFRTASENEHETKTIITKVEFTGLKSYGDCVISFGENETASVSWPTIGGSGSFTLEFDNPEYSTQPWVEGTQTYEKDTEEPENNKFGDSWYAAAADRNLNNENGELTFWFIPQEITSNVKLKVTFCVKTPDTSGASGAGFITQEIDFGTIVNKDRSTPVKWDAGQLRTYTLNPKVVDVEIFDTMAGLKKTGLHVTNTGNVSEYVRMMVIGNWYGWASQDDADAGKEPMILVGYTHSEYANKEMVTPWFREDEKYGSYFDETFTGGKPVASKGNEWIFGTGSYFYYPTVIGPNSELAETSALFQSYELPADEIPTIYIPTSSSSTRIAAVGVHLVMEVVIQAISSTAPDGTPYANWKAAWTVATGETITEKN